MLRRSFVQRRFAAVLLLLAAGCSRNVTAPKAPEPPEEQVFGIGVGSSTLVAVIDRGIVRSTDLGSRWSTVDSVQAFQVRSSGSAIVVNAFGPLYSADDGLHWQRGTGIPTQGIHDFTVDAGTFYASVASDGVYRSSDGGAHWESSSAGLPDSTEYPIAASGGVLLTRSGSHFYRSTDGGDSWTRLGVWPGPRYDFMTLAAAGGRFYFGMRSTLFVSSDRGSTWTPLRAFPENDFIDALIGCGSNLYVVTSLGTYRSKDGDATPLPFARGMDVNDVVEHDGSIFIATNRGGVQRSDDDGATWTRLGFTGGTPPGVAYDPPNH